MEELVDNNMLYLAVRPIISGFQLGQSYFHYSDSIDLCFWLPLTGTRLNNSLGTIYFNIVVLNGRLKTTKTKQKTIKTRKRLKTTTKAL